MFLFRLALALGKSVREVEEFGASELGEWESYWRQEPWGPYRDNLHAGLICSVLANIHRRSGSPEITYEDFMLKDKDQHKQLETRRALAWFRGVAKK